PGYYIAKHIIHLINAVAEKINSDKAVNSLLKVVFLENYNVSLAERIFAGADLSEQISTAGTEASATGNMKFCLNGALTIGTMDGANIEIREQVGQDNIFIFGLETDEVEQLRIRGYDPANFIKKSPLLSRALDLIAEGHFSNGDRQMFRPFVDMMKGSDHYLVAADFQDYILAQNKVDVEYRTEDLWTRKSIINVANSGKFSSDRTIRDYAQEIWRLKPVIPPPAGE
ncbi:MAG: glycogen/starch/alpha-glucan phosphorylase, partial [Planctomycetes bacterium]|nr:glycogen/starch/alpha-glucan phosphorylase [Planctomycetota bacterium]